MRVVFLGTPEFAVPSLRALAERHDIVAVYTRPDAVSGRGGKTRPSAVKSAAIELAIPVHQPKTLRDAEQVASLRALDADIVIVAAYGLILTADVLESARLGAVNVHASLLPRWRGAAPIQRAILAGDQTAGVSIMRMEVGLDTGPYCSQLSTPVADKDARTLTSEIAELGAIALVEALPAIEGGSAQWTVQDESLVTYAEKVAKTDVAIAPDMPVETAVRRVRASLPAAPTRVFLGERGATLLAADRAAQSIAPGALACTKTGLLLGMSDGALEVTRVKPDGKGEMDACAWARGVRDLESASWKGTL